MQYTFPADVDAFVDTGIFIRADGYRALTGDWDIGAGRILKAETIQGRVDNLNFIGSRFGFNQPSPECTIDLLDAALDINDTIVGSLGIGPTITGTLSNNRVAAALRFMADNSATPGSYSLALYGVYGSAKNLDGYLLSSVTGLSGTGYSSHTTGVVNQAIGTYSRAYQTGAGTITNAYAFYGSVNSLQNGIVTNAYGCYLTVAPNGGSMGTGYGLYINAVGGSTAWGIYVNAAVNNYFAGNIGIGNDAPTALLDISSDILRLRTAKTPASAAAAGNAGDICWDANYVYVCVAANTWKRAPLSTW